MPKGSTGALWRSAKKHSVLIILMWPIAVNNLAELHREQGRYNEAVELHTRALAIRERALGSYHLDVGMSLDNLARVYLAQNRLDRAELCSRAVEIAAKHLSVSSAQRSGAALGEQRHNRFFFTN